MKADTEKIRWLLDNCTQYRINKDTGVSQGLLSELKSGKREIEKISIMIGAKLTAYAETLKNTPE